MSEQIVYLNGQYLPAQEAKVSIYDSGLLHGVGLFETMRAYGGVVFRAAHHLERLYASAEKLGLRTPDDRDSLLAAIDEVLQRNDLKDARIRLTVTMGDIRGSSEDEPASPTVLITAVPFEPYPPMLYEKGITVLISSWRQSKHDPVCGHKVTCFMPRLLALREAQRAGCAEAVWFTTENLLAEGSVSNIFLVKDGKLLTPPVDTPILPGITRAAVIEVARREGLPVEERPLTIDDLLGAEEVFLTNTAMELLPVCRIERHAVGRERPGEVWKRLYDGFKKIVADECGLEGDQSTQQ